MRAFTESEFMLTIQLTDTVKCNKGNCKDQDNIKRSYQCKLNFIIIFPEAQHKHHYPYVKQNKKKQIILDSKFG